MVYPKSEHATGILLSAIVISFVVASSLNIYPLNPNIATLRPIVMIMVLIFWLLFQPRYVGVFTAFFIGIIGDLLMDTRLGQQAFAAVVVALIIKAGTVHIKQLKFGSAWLLATLGLLLFQSVLWLLQLIMQSLFVTQSVLPLIISIISWPLVLFALRKFTYE